AQSEAAEEAQRRFPVEAFEQDLERPSERELAEIVEPRLALRAVDESFRGQRARRRPIALRDPVTERKASPKKRRRQLRPQTRSRHRPGRDLPFSGNGRPIGCGAADLSNLTHRKKLSKTRASETIRSSM